MNPLQTNPELFVGNFKVRCDLEGSEIWTITGIKRRVGSENTYLTIEDESFYEVETPVDSCTLIARSVDDMTAEELEMVSGLNAKDLIEWEKVEEEREQLKRWVNSPGHSLSFRHARSLLDISVLPFPQSHFGDTVIDTRTLTNA